MVKSISKNISVAWIFAPLFLIAVIVLFVNSSYFLQVSDEVSKYIVLDLLVTIPIVYFLIVRKTNIPVTTVVPVILAGMLIGYTLLPADQHHYLDLFKQYGVPVFEISVLFFVVFKVRQAIKKFERNNTGEIDFYTVLKKTSKEILPGRLSSLLTSEISVIYYGFLNWKSPTLTTSQFTYHKKSGTPSLFGALIFIIGVETVALHVVLQQWSVITAWVLSVLSVYTGLQLLGYARSLSKRPISLTDNELILRYGILNEARIQLSDIESIELTRKQLDWNEENRKFSILGELESHNLVIHCHRLQIMDGVYGITKTFKSLALHVDEKERFKNEIMKAVEEGNKNK